MTDTLRDDDLLSTEQVNNYEEERVHLLDSIKDLEARVARAEQEVLGAQLAHIREIEIISNALIEEADQAELCGQYDNVVSGINSMVKVPLLMREVDVSIHVRGEVTFRFDRRFEMPVPMGIQANDPIVRERVAGVLRSMGIRALAMSAEEESVDIQLDQPLSY